MVWPLHPRTRAVLAQLGQLEALAQARGDSLVVIAGSLYLIGEAMELLHLAPVRASDEKGLNEWSVRS